MEFTLRWIQLVIVVAAVQGLFLAATLLAQQKNRTANRLLAATMVAFTLYLLSSVYIDAGLVARYPHFFGVAYPLPWIFGPLVYLYTVAASDQSWRMSRRDWLHFLPFVLIVLLGAPVYLLNGPDKIAMYERLYAGDVPASIAIPGPTKYLSGIAYTIATIVHVRRHARRVEHSYSNTARVNLSWLLWFCGAAAFIWLMATTLPITDFGARLREEHVSLAIAILVYSIGYAGLRQPEIFRYETSDAVPAPVKPAAAAPATPTPEPQKYERSGLDDAEAVRLRDRLLRVMDAKRPWADSELTLADLAEQLESTPHKLSEVLNSQIGQTFYDFVNAYRVREVQRRIQAGEARRVKMLALAMDAGFASKSTFNHVFKKHTNLTPSAFEAQIGVV
jgi:AraC-like DNA-binding protein